MNAITRLAGYAGRPLLMRAENALELAERVRALDPRLLERRVSRPAAFFDRLLNRDRRPVVMEDYDDDDERVRKPIGPVCYAPRYAAAPVEQGFGWSLVESIAAIDIEGPLLDRGYEFCGAWCHGYDTLAVTFREAAAHPQVKGLFVRMSSPGGVVDGGLPALAAQIRGLREAAGGKPVWVYADIACSAAYWIAAQADRIIAPPVGMVGSIGAVIVHADYSGALEKAGIRVTAIQFGAHKTDGAEWKPLGDDVKATLQAEIDQCGRLFVADVARGRPALTAPKQIATQADVFMGAHDEAARSALALGLVDEVALEEAAFHALQAHVGVRAAPSISTVKPNTSDQDRAAAAKPEGSQQPAAKMENDMRTKEARIAAILARTGQGNGKDALTEHEQLEEIKKILAEPADDAPEEAAEEEAAPEGEGDPPADDEEEKPEGDEEEKPAAGKKAKAETVAAIMALPEARGREATASALALAGVGVADAKKVLKTAPRASRLNAPDPKLGADAGAEANGARGGAKSSDQKAADFVLDCQRIARGGKQTAK